MTRQMTKQEYFEFIESTNKKLLTLVKKKNNDYSPGDSPFANFQDAKDFGLHPITGLALRMGDKFKRIKSWCSGSTLQVESDSIEDSFLDIIGYCWLALGMLEEERLKIESLNDNDYTYGG